MNEIKAGKSATYIGETVEFPGEFTWLRQGATVFVRSIEGARAWVQNPWDSADRLTVNLEELVVR